MSKTTESLRERIDAILNQIFDEYTPEARKWWLKASRAAIEAELASARRENNEEGFKKGIGLAKEFALVALKEYFNRQTPEQGTQ